MKKCSRALSYILSFALVMTLLGSLGLSGAVPAAEAAGDDRIYYFNMSGGAEGSCMLVESNGHWGLVDTGHRYSDTIQDYNGVIYSVTQGAGLSSQINCRNGKDAADYMINRLGVTHLDFIVGTHGHSDHIGGVPEIAQTSLVDNSTVYYYKDYQHVSTQEDDLAGYHDYSWHNQAFVYQALKTMQEQGAQTAEVSHQQVIPSETGNPYGDYITFTLGDMTFRLYNLYNDPNDVNAGSIVTALTNGDYTVVNLADINIVNHAIDNTIQAIGRDYGNVDIVVAGHHGYSGSNTKKMFDTLKPEFVIVSNGIESNVFSTTDLAAALPYAESQYGTSFYTTALSQHAVVTDLSGNQVWIYDLEDSGSLQDFMDNAVRAYNTTGWVSWVNSDSVLWSYMENGKPVKNCWKIINGKYYYFYDDGIMAANTFVGNDYVDASGAWVPGYASVGAVGMVYRDGNYYFRFNDGSWACGWVYLDGNWFYFGEDKAMATYWQWIDGQLYYFYENGIMAVNTWVDGFRLGPTGAWTKDYWNPGWYEWEGGLKRAYRLQDGVTWATGWQFIDGYWYCFGDDYWMLRGWNTVGDKRYFFYDDGKMAADAWIGDYYVDPSGAWNPDAFIPGWQGNKTSFRFDNGDWAQGWVFLDGHWFYFGEDHEKLIGWHTIGDKRYFFDWDGYLAMDTWVGDYYVDASGAWIPDYVVPGWYEWEGGLKRAYRLQDGVTWATGWQFIDGSWYCFGDDYWMLRGWNTVGDKRYFFYDDGKMAADAWIGDYYVDPSGAWNPDAFIPGWQGNGTSFRFDNGDWAQGWQFIDGHWYYFGEDHAKLIGWHTIDDKHYFFDWDGIMAADTWVGDYYVDASGALVQ